jgi:hypothetical protein
VLFHFATLLLALSDTVRLSFGPKFLEHEPTFAPASFLASNLLTLFPR